MLTAESNLHHLARDLPAGDRRRARHGWRRRARSTASRRGRLPAAIIEARARHPAVTTAMFNVDAALFQVKIAEGALYPTLERRRQRAARTMARHQSLTTLESFAASVVGQLTVPLYQGGTEYATIRQAKETLGQRRIDLDTARDQSQQTLVQSWGQLEAAKAQIQATTTQVNAAEIALNGVREEARVGQRTTLDVLNAQQELVNARVALVTAQRDRVVASYSLLAASGGCRRRCCSSTCRSTTRWCTTSRSATPGSACALPTENNPRVLAAANAFAARALSTRLAFAFALRHAILATIRVDIEWRVIRRGAWIPTRRRSGDCTGMAMTQPAKAQEPSMEEILASIRRIIADDDTAKPAAAEARAAPPRRRCRRAPPRCRRAIRCRRRRRRGRPRRHRRLPRWISAISTRCWRGSMRRRGRRSPAEDVLELTEQMAAPPRPRRRASGPSTASRT